MKGRSFFTIVIFCFYFGSISSQELNPEYDSLRAAHFKADDYGMKYYCFVLLKTGSAEVSDKEKLSGLFRGHLDNIKRLVKEGKMIVAGPFEKNEFYRGLFILDTQDTNEARLWLDSDPAVEAKLLEPLIIRWYGSAALPAYISESYKIGKYKI